MSALDAAIVLAFVVWAIASGLASRREASRGLEDYFLAGRTLPGWQAGMSMAATQFAADTPLLVTGLIATAGLFSLWRLWIYALAFLLLGFVLARSWRRAGVLTDAELAEVRYGSRGAPALRAVKAVYFGTVFNCTVLAMVLFAAKEIAAPLLLWDAWLPPGVFGACESIVRGIGVALSLDGVAAGGWARATNDAISLGAILGVTAFYSATGGLRAVVRTDVVQLGVMLLATLLYAIFVVHAAGGLAGLPERVAAVEAGLGRSADDVLLLTPSWRNVDSGALLGVIGLQWLLQMNSDGTGYLAQRAMACRSDRDARTAAIVFTLVQVLLRSLLWIPLGLALLVLFPPDPALSGTALQADREATYVRGMRELLPSGLRGLLLAGMFAALASTIDTHINWGASYWTNDLYARFWCRWRGRAASARELVWAARASTLGVLLVALAIMTQLASIQAAWQASLLLGAGMGVILILRWIWWRLTATAELATIAASSVLAPAMLAWLPDAEALRLLIVAGAATAIGVATSLATRPEPAERLLDFYRRARPPGFWAPVARAAGADPARDAARLGRGLAATGAAAFSLFCVLTASASWIAGSPAPEWTPSRPLWLTGTLGAGLALVPLWWRLGFAGSADES